MKIKDSIAKWILGGYSYIGRPDGKSHFNDFNEIRFEFAQVMFMNIVELLTDITNDVVLTLRKGDVMRFAEFNVFFNNYGQETLNVLFNNGFAIIAYNASGFNLLETDDYTTDSKNKILVTNPNFNNSELYVLKSDTFKMNGKSDRQFLNGFLTYLDNILNASNTTTARLGSLIMASPKPDSASKVATIVTDIEKQELEKDISDNYGGLKNQKQIQIWRVPMDFVTVNLSGLDSKTIEKSKFAISAICDRLKIPSNQVSIIESNSGGNALSNGGEIREGDLLKYKSYERLLNKTFIKMASDLDLVIDYKIYNKPEPKIQEPQQF